MNYCNEEKYLIEAQESLAKTANDLSEAEQSLREHYKSTEKSLQP